MKKTISEFKFKLEEFEGPMDLLLHLVKTQKKDIKDVNLHDLVKQYVDIVNQSDVNLEVAGEYLVGAAYLTEYKSKKYLPEKPKKENLSKEEYERLEEDNLIKRIIRYEKFKNLAKKLTEINEVTSMQFEKSYERDLLNELRPNIDELNNRKVKNLSEDNLINAALKLLERAKDENKTVNIRKKRISIDERKAEINEIFSSSNNNKVKFTDLFEFYDNHYISVTLLIILDYVRWNNYLISQDGEFGEIFISKETNI